MTRLLLAMLTAALPFEATAQVTPRSFMLSAQDGVSLHAYEWSADDAGQSPYVVLFHQGGGNALGEYTPIAPRLVEAGYRVLAIDQRSGGTLFDGVNRTVENLGREVDSYCEPMPDLEAALAYARSQSPDSKAIVWGSSYSAALAIILAEQHPDDVAAVLAFSPATGDPMEGCRPESAAGRLTVPLLAFRPGREAAIESVAAQLETLRGQGHEVHVLDPGVHGSSMLVESRVQADVSRGWEIVMDFLSRVDPGR